MSKSVQITVLFLTLLAVITGCTEDNNIIADTDAVVSSFKFPLPSISSASIVDRVTVTVSGPGMENISSDLTIDGVEAAGIIEIPAGEQRVFRAEAFIASIIYFSGISEPVDVTARSEITVTINMIDLTPDLQILEPLSEFTTADQSFVITWIDSDYDDDAQISLFYGPDTVFSNAAPIPGAQSISENDPANNFTWNTSNLDSGEVYFIFGKISDVLHPAETFCSSGTVSITHEPGENIPPVIQITQPDGIDDVCDQNFLITWVDSDPDNDAEISLLYGYEADFYPGGGGISIPGASNISEDDENDSFNWDTSGLPDSSDVFICALIQDYINNANISYGSGPVSINHSLSSMPPAAPANLTAATISIDCIELAWSDNSQNEDGFIVERHIDGGAFQILAQLEANQSGYEDTLLSSATTYYYRVKAFNAAGPSEYSNTASGSTQYPVPASPAGLNVQPVSASELQLAWDDNSGNELGFIIERRSGNSGTFSRIDTVATDQDSFEDTSLQAGSLYQYRICAYNEGGESGYSNIDGAETLELLPEPPSNLTAAGQSAFSVSLNWQDNSTNEDGFYLERSSASAGPYARIHTTSPNTQNYQDDSVDPSTIYYYKICSYNSAGQSDYCQPDSAESFAYDPAPPENLIVTGVTANSVSLQWDDMSDNEDGFNIERRTGTSGDFTLIGQTAANDHDYTDLQANQLTTYFYRVQAYNQWAESAYSNTAEAATLEFSVFDLVTVPAGIFTMGNEPYGYGNEFHPGNPVDVGGFEMMIDPVTNAEYAVFLDEMYSAGGVVVYNGLVYNHDTTIVYLSLNNLDCQIEFDGDDFYAEGGTADYPVTLVSWHGANEFAFYYDMNLPSEAEWEKAARGTQGSDTNGDGVGDGFKYPWGNTISGAYANYNDSGDPWETGSNPLTSPVGAYDGTNYSGFQTYDNSSLYEVYDLCGNVYEWTEDWLGDYQDPHEPPPSGNYRVIRGGAWSSSTYFCRNAYRQGKTATSRFNDLGFRCVRRN